MFGIGDGPAQIVPQSPHAPDILGRIFQLSDGLVAAHQVHHGLQGVDYPARAGHGPIDFVAYLGEGVGQLVRTAGQLVQLASVLFEQGGRFVELAAHFTSLKRDLGLLQRFPVRSGQAPHHHDVGQFCYLAGHHLDVGKRAGCPQVSGDLMNSTIGVIAFIGKWRFIASYPLTLSTCCGTVLRSS